MTKTVYVVGGDHSTTKMFKAAGWNTIGFPQTQIMPDLVCFTGGADVSPHMYGEENISSHCDPIRDEFEKQVFEAYVGKAPMIGICRGGQFLNVMNGGKLIQDHGLVSGKVQMCGYLNYPNPKAIEIGPMHVDHHQGILCLNGAERAWIGWDEYPKKQNPERWPVYVAWYEQTRCLCFQPHPEWGHQPTRDYFFNLIEEYIFPAPMEALLGEMGKPT